MRWHARTRAHLHSHTFGAVEIAKLGQPYWRVGLVDRWMYVLILVLLRLGSHCRRVEKTWCCLHHPVRGCFSTIDEVGLEAMV
jgi:hypothetical protein